MSLAFHRTPGNRRMIERGWLLAGGLALILSAAGFAALRHLEHEGVWRPRTAPNAPVPVWPASGGPNPEAARAFRAEPVSESGSSARRYRLAGTFLPWDQAGTRQRKAILDDLTAQRQHLVSEGDVVGDLRVVRIGPDRIRVTVGGRDEELLLAFSGVQGSSRDALHPRPELRADRPGEEGEPMQYGRRVGENRWVIEREALMEYYHEMLDDPVRIARIYRSFVPEVSDEGGINGYRLDVRGEEDFFRDVGLQPGDRIRAVNSLPMTSQARAEYFLGEFVRDDLGAVVLDIERDGASRKLIYMMR